MRVVGIIAEYNPFHNGHAYQIQKAKALSSADFCIVAMSGNYVQRGVPAVTDKFSRAGMALQNGADMVIELPTLWATASAEYFAAAGIALFDALGCIDTICFGCETPNLPLLTSVAEILAAEPEIYAGFLSSYLKEGLTFPAAREKAMLSYIAQNPLPQPDLSCDACKKELDRLLVSPNNILALEYIKALIRCGSSIKPLPIIRKGAGYHAADLKEDFCSATAIRNHLFRDKPLSPETKQSLSCYLPKETADFLFAPDRCFLSEEDFSSMLYYKLLQEQTQGFAEYADISAELSNKIVNFLRQFTGFQNFCNLLKSKDITHSRISRMLLHILLNIKDTDYQQGKNCGYIPYLRILGFRKEASPLFSSIRSHSSLPIVSRPAKDILRLDPYAQTLLSKDIFASNLYYGTLAQKSGCIQKNEFQQKILIFS